jgi:hypothetical protein
MSIYYQTFLSDGVVVKLEHLPHTSHFRSKVAVFVKAFFWRNISANFFAATNIGSELSLDTLIGSTGQRQHMFNIDVSGWIDSLWGKQSGENQEEHLWLEKASRHRNESRSTPVYIWNYRMSCKQTQNHTGHVDDIPITRFFRTGRLKPIYASRLHVDGRYFSVIMCR